MKKSYLISIKPEWAVKILNKEKIYEIRRKVNQTILEALDNGLSVEMYMYVTKHGKEAHHSRLASGQKNKNYPYVYGFHLNDYSHKGAKYVNGLIPCKLTIDGYEVLKHQEFMDNGYEDPRTYAYFYDEDHPMLKQMCLTHEQLEDYGNGKDLFALHISKVEIFDEPKQLGEFYRDYEVLSHDKDGNEVYSVDTPYFQLKRPPQNMQSIWMK